MSAKTTRKEPKVAAGSNDAARAAAQGAPGTAAEKLEGTTLRPRAPRQSKSGAQSDPGAAKPARRGGQDGRIRAIIDRVIPEVDCGRFAVKRVVGDTMNVEAHVFTDGHDTLAVVLRHRHESESEWRETPMALRYNDEWLASFPLQRLGHYHYSVIAWVDHFLSWRNEFKRRVDPADIAIAARVGEKLVRHAAERADGDDAKKLGEWARKLGSAKDTEEIKRLVLDDSLAEIARRYPDRSLAAEYDKGLRVFVDRERARFSSWYEFFPRSTGKDGKHGTLRDAAARLDYVKGLGFDVVYLPPIHPIGKVKRKGRNNALEAAPGDYGSPWAIGSDEGGHKAIHPELGGIEDFRALVARAKELEIDVALDIAFQTAPDHPYVKEHPSWFNWRPDGTVQYAENPPKKYQDIYPFNFESDDWTGLWDELKSVFDYWIDEGVRVFRVDNPHTKPFPFWQWAIGEIQRQNPDVIFLAEAFTRPKIMHRLAKLGYTQSYTYFAWRNTKRELIEYFNELAHGPGAEYFRPNVWPNTPDILTEHLQHGGRPAFVSRLLLAGTLAASYGIYGPAYELSERVPREHGSEEYLHSEKYEIRSWNLEREDSLRYLIARVNQIRRENPALQNDRTLTFVGTDNDQLIAYLKVTPDLSNALLIVVNLDPHHRQTGWVEVDLDALALAHDAPYQVHDLLTDACFHWRGRRNYVDLGPGMGHVFAVGRHMRDERDTDNFA